ncbi:MAG: hypothetical protein KDD00_11530 [Ignavibacteriae bacterium]|nr:hypothetical protein [Ignavibacteriota bacterium]
MQIFWNTNSGSKINLKIPDENTGEHSVYFNRGVAGSLAYARKFKNRIPGSIEMTEKETQEALKWLSRGLEEAMIDFIKKAKNDSYALRAAVYEFRYLPVLDEFKDAYEERGVDVQIIFDGRGELSENSEAITESGIPWDILKARKNEAEKSYISHNKFIVLLKDDEPVEVWTGSTNLTEKGIFGQCNVGHVVRNKEIAYKYFQYWNFLKEDPQNATFDTQTLEIEPDIDYEELKTGTTVFFSPRKTKKILKTYADCLANSKQLICGMFPFSFSKKMKEIIKQDTNFLKYVIIDKKTVYTTLTSNDIDNVIVYGTNLKDGLYDWLSEIHSGNLFNPNRPGAGTNFIHNKVILIDPLSEDPIVITGSANFSDNSISGNDENTIVIRGDKDVADLYFTEFVRIFNHYYSRYIAIKMSLEFPNQENPLLLKTDYTKWVTSFFNPNGLKYKRKKMFDDMKA